MEITVHHGEMKEAKVMAESCRLCDEDQPPIVLWGLSILDIEYPGQARFICSTCMTKIRKWMK